MIDPRTILGGEIEKNIPYNYAGVRNKYQLDAFEVGDSYTFDRKYSQQLASAASHHTKRKGGKFSIKKISETEATLTRIE